MVAIFLAFILVRFSRSKTLNDKPIISDLPSSGVYKKCLFSKIIIIIDQQENKIKRKILFIPISAKSFSFNKETKELEIKWKSNGEKRKTWIMTMNDENELSLVSKTTSFEDKKWKKQLEK